MPGPSKKRKKAIEENREEQLREFYEGVAASQQAESRGSEGEAEPRDEGGDKRRRDRRRKKREAMERARRERAKKRAEEAKRRAERSESRTAALSDSAGAKDEGLSEAEQLLADLEGEGGGGKKGKGRAPLGGKGGTNRDAAQPIGGVGASGAPFGYVNLPGFTEDAANTGFGTITTEGMAAVRAANADDPRFAQWQPPAITARYLEDDDQAILGELYGTDDFLEVQAALKARHPGRAAYTPGVLDDNTREWFREALGDANAAGVSWQDILWGPQFAAAGEPTDGSGSGSGYGSSGGGGGGGGAAVLTSPEAIRQAADEIAQETIGRRLDAGIKESLVAEIHALEAAEETSNVTTDIDAELRRRIREQRGGEARGHDFAAAANVIFSALGAGPGGGFGSGFGSQTTGPQGGSVI